MIKHKQHSRAKKERARELFVKGGLTLREAATRLKIPWSTLARWSSEARPDTWGVQQERYQARVQKERDKRDVKRQAKSSIKTDEIINAWKDKIDPLVLQGLARILKRSITLSESEQEPHKLKALLETLCLAHDRVKPMLVTESNQAKGAKIILIRAEKEELPDNLEKVIDDLKKQANE